MLHVDDNIETTYVLSYLNFGIVHVYYLEKHAEQPWC